MKREILRWAVGSPNGPRSSVWRLWGNAKGDIYLAVRRLGGIIKASFHRDGKCQMGFTSEYAATAISRFGKDNRHWQTWRLSPESVARAVQILVPWSELRPFLGQETKRIVWLPPPLPNFVTIISIFLAPPDLEVEAPADIRGGGLVGSVRTNVWNGWAFYAHSSIGTDLAQTIATERAKLQKLPDPAIGTRAILWDLKPDRREVQVLELAHDCP